MQIAFDLTLVLFTLNSDMPSETRIPSLYYSWCDVFSPTNFIVPYDTGYYMICGVSNVDVMNDVYEVTKRTITYKLYHTLPRNSQLSVL